MADIDDIAVERAIHGDRVRLTTAERAEAIARMTANGLSGEEIASRLRRTRRTVCRYRAQRRRDMLRIVDEPAPWGQENAREEVTDAA